MTTTQDHIIAAAIARAEKLGKKHGENAAEWVAQDAWGSRCTSGAYDNAAAFLRGIEDGDPAILDAYQAPNLSGAWADTMTPGRLLDHVFDTEADFAECADSEDAICLAYEDAANNGFWGRLEESAAAMLDHE
jgi:hypothetical protein